MTEYRVLVSRDGGENWRTHTVEASTGDASIGKVRDAAANSEIKADTDTQFYALSRPPKKMQRQIIERWELGPVDEEGLTTEMELPKS